MYLDISVFSVLLHANERVFI